MSDADTGGQRGDVPLLLSLFQGASSKPRQQLREERARQKEEHARSKHEAHARRKEERAQLKQEQARRKQEQRGREREEQAGRKAEASQRKKEEQGRRKADRAQTREERRAAKAGRQADKLARKEPKDSVPGPAPPEGGLRLNLGCGNKYLPDYENVDLYAGKVDRRSDLRTLEYPPNTVGEALLVHVLEHLERPEAVSLLGRIFQWLRPGGCVVIEVPDRVKCLRLIKRGFQRSDESLVLRGAQGLLGGRGEDKEGWRKWLVGHADRISSACRGGEIPARLNIPPPWDSLPGEPHRWAWSAEEMAEVLRGIGCVSVSPDEVPRSKHGYGKGKDRDSRIVGYKPA